MPSCRYFETGVNHTTGFHVLPSKALLAIVYVFEKTEAEAEAITIMYNTFIDDKNQRIRRLYFVYIFVKLTDAAADSVYHYKHKKIQNRKSKRYTAVPRFCA